MSTFSTLLKEGYGTIYAVKVEGLPYVFHEGPTPYRVDVNGTPSAPGGYTSSAAFMVVNDTTIDQELNREGAVSRGKSMSILLSWDVLEAEGILDDLFRRPAYFTTLTADVSSSDTTINVADTSSFASSGTFYLGRELIKYTGKTSTTFTGCTRGYLGYTYKFRKDDPGSHGIVTPTPYAWKGRFLTIYEHIVTPSGHILDGTWTEGAYQRELFKGYIDDPPVPGKLGMSLKAMPLQRLGAMELGSNLQGETVGIDPAKNMGDALIYVGHGSTMEFTVAPRTSGSSGAIGAFKTYKVPNIQTGATYPSTAVFGAGTPSNAAIPPGVYTVNAWANICGNRLAYEMLNDSSVSPTYDLTTVTGQVKTTKTDPGNGGQWADQNFIEWTVILDWGYSIPWYIFADPSPSCYWCESAGKQFDIVNKWFSSGGTPNFFWTFAIPFGLRSSDYLVVKNLEGDSALDFTIEPTGLASVEAGGNSEGIRWSEKFTVFANSSISISPFVVLHVVERMIGAEYASVPQLPANLSESGSIEIVSGKIGKIDDVAETFLQSSGTGDRGSKDTLGIGYGLGIPSAWIDLDATGSSLLSQEAIPLLALGGASFDAIFAGWYQLEGTCLALRRNASNVLQLQRVDVVPSKVISTGALGFMGQELAKADVVLGGTEVPRLVVAPNQIRVDTTVGPYESAQYTYNAVGRIQAEGAQGMSLAVPGGRSDIISTAILSIMARGLGQSIIKFNVAPWIDIQVGDPISVTVAHPLLYDWADGTRSPTNIPGRCVGHSRNLNTGEQALTILLDGILDSALWLCPTVTVSNVAGNDVTVGYGGWFQSGETVRFYNRGKEATEMSDLVVTTVAGNVLTLASSPPAWLTSANATRATHPAYASGSTDQKDPFLYVRGDKNWRG